MRVLLDHCVARQFGRLLEGHEVSTAQECGLADIGNGKLILAAAERGFDVLLSLDKGLAHQQNVQSLPIVVMLFRSRSGDLDVLRESVPAILDALERLDHSDFRDALTKPFIVIPAV